MSYSVVTLVKGRKKQVQNLLASLAASTLLPHEVIIVWMEPESPHSIVSHPQLVVHQVYMEGEALPLAAARNKGFAEASTDTVIFLDVDCICSPTVCEQMLNQLTPSTIVSAAVRYLPYLPLTGEYSQHCSQAISHPRRAQLEHSVALPHRMFWSLVFAVCKQTFEQIGGFDEEFAGYGGEDTDFAERFHQADIKFLLCDDEVLHQYHTKYLPPVNYIGDICTNANYFYRKHGYFPMRKWLDAFCERHWVTFDEGKQQYRVQTPPTQAEIDAALSLTAY